jgi:glycosyltransferase involved in cell wall biosynthesis
VRQAARSPRPDGRGPSPSLARLAVRTHAVQARLVSVLPLRFRESVRAALARGGKVRRAEQVDEWGRRRHGHAIADWSTPLVGAPGAMPPAAIMEASTPVEAVYSAMAESPVHTDAEAPPLRCAFVTTVFDVGGVGEVVAFLATRLREHGIHPAVLNTVANPTVDSQPQGRLGRRLADLGIEVVEADEVSGRRWLASWQPDVVYGHGAPDWVISAANDLPVPYVDALHGMHSFFDGDWSAEARRAQGITMIVSVSDLVRRQYLAGNPSYPAKDIVSIPNAVDERRFRPVDRDAIRSALGLSDEYLFVCLARHCLQKNTYGLVNAFAELATRHPQAHLVIAGRVDDDRYYRHLVRLHESLAAGDRIHLRDHVSEPRTLLAAADGFVLDSYFEGWSLASMEALLSGVPAVISDVGGAREQIDGEPRRGFVVANPLGDPLAVSWRSIGANRYSSQVNQAELGTAMSTLVEQRAEYAERRAELARESAARFEVSTCLTRHAAVLHDVVKQAALLGARGG